MLLKKCSIDNVMYGHSPSIPDLWKDVSPASPHAALSNLCNRSLRNGHRPSVRFRPECCCECARSRLAHLCALAIFQKLLHKRLLELHPVILDFFRCLALNHTAQPARSRGKGSLVCVPCCLFRGWREGEGRFCG